MNLILRKRSMLLLKCITQILKEILLNQMPLKMRINLKKSRMHMIFSQMKSKRDSMMISEHRSRWKKKARAIMLDLLHIGHTHMTKSNHNQRDKPLTTVMMHTISTTISKKNSLKDSINHITMRKPRNSIREVMNKLNKKDHGRIHMDNTLKEKKKNSKSFTKS